MRSCCAALSLGEVCLESSFRDDVKLQVAEKALQTYERDGWSEFNTQIVPERREIRPTADRGPILLCVDTSGSMRGPREVVAKALALECMRAARAQVRPPTSVLLSGRTCRGDTPSSCQPSMG